jgi:hypothetical protein
MNRTRTVAATAVAMLTLAATGPATAVTPSYVDDCSYGYQAGCYDYTDDTLMGVITASPSLIIRMAPTPRSGKVKTVKKHSRVWIACWTYGAYVRPGKGRPSTDVWDWLVYQSGRNGWVSDAYVNTGGVSPKRLIQQCEMD